MRKILKSKGISEKRFRLLIHRSMKDNIDELIRYGNIIEAEVNKYFVKHREEIITKYLNINGTELGRKAYIKNYMRAIIKYEKIRKLEIHGNINKYSPEEQEKKQNQKKECIDILKDITIYSFNGNWHKELSYLFAHGPITESTNCMKFKNSIKDMLDPEIKKILEFIPERMINAIINEKYKRFRANLKNLLSQNIQKALEQYPLINKDATLNKLQLGYVIFNTEKDKSITAYIGYKKDSPLFPKPREKYKFNITTYDTETLENIERENVSIVDIDKSLQYKVYITREKKLDSYILCVTHGMRMYYDDLQVNQNIPILVTNTKTYRLENVNILIEGEETKYNDDIYRISNNINKKYESLIAIDNTMGITCRHNSTFINYKQTILGLTDSIRILYVELSRHIAIEIKNWCLKNNTNIVVIYYMPDLLLNKNKLSFNGKILKYNMITFLAELGIECILIDQSNDNSNLYEKFRHAELFPKKYKEINEYVINKLRDIEFDDSTIVKLRAHNKKILEANNYAIRRIYSNGSFNYYL